MKQCRICLAFKDPSEFPPHRLYCRDCKKAQDREYARDPGVKQRIAAYQKQYAIQHKEQIKERDHQYYIENGDKIRAYNKQWRQSHPEAFRAYQQTFRAANLDAVRSHDVSRQHERRAHLRNTTVEKFTREEIFERDQWVCHICQRKVTKITASLDHLVPQSLGGPHTRQNVATAHRLCNSKRNIGYLPAQLRMF